MSNFGVKTRRGFQKLCALLELDMVEIMASYFAPVRIALYMCPVFHKDVFVCSVAPVEDCSIQRWNSKVSMDIVAYPRHTTSSSHSAL